jgi:hypothetical protein
MLVLIKSGPFSADGVLGRWLYEARGGICDDDGREKWRLV